MPAATSVDKYTIHDARGAGAMCNIYTALDPDLPAVPLVAKLCPLHRCKHSVLQHFEASLAVHSTLQHENIVRIRHVSVDKTSVAVICDDAGTSLGDLVNQSYPRGFGEAQARLYFQQLLRAVAFMHSQHIVHKSLTMWKLLIDDTGRLRLNSVSITELCITVEELLHTFDGIPMHVAPEVLKGDSPTTHSDMWAAGVVLYIMLCGKPPFADKSFLAMCRATIAGVYEEADGWSDELRSLMRRLLAPEPADRLTAEEALRDPWVTADDAHGPCNAEVIQQTGCGSTEQVAEQADLEVRLPPGFDD
eukprot:NODE_2254_length_1102_cov_132.292308_g2236_i0.p1 GENE.NODE_2254_length_1102_cov_132.292308_g2236_i0~~NODE_2254_length_1102_cov_132.292308_g2236_i0.p1  ORF type:complete len:305 (+),score=34.25 NODE_2254_length_1102_cov_132.292308_g2236_i0:100-1014(+)